MAAARKRLGARIHALGPDLPLEGVWLWGAFCALDETRESGFGVGAISFTEMKSYADLWGFRWAPAEIAIIRALDRAYRVFRGQEHGKGGGHGDSKRA